MLLKFLLSDEFSDSVGFILPPAPLRLLLEKSRVVRNIERALRHRELTEAEIRDFAASLSREFKPGEALPGDLALAALAVALERLPADYAEEFIRDLARLRMAEMPTSTRVARECLRQRREFPKNEVRVSRYPSPPKQAKKNRAKLKGYGCQGIFSKNLRAVVKTGKPIRYPIKTENRRRGKAYAKA